MATQCPQDDKLSTSPEKLVHSLLTREIGLYAYQLNLIFIVLNSLLLFYCTCSHTVIQVLNPDSPELFSVIKRRKLCFKKVKGVLEWQN